MKTTFVVQIGRVLTKLLIAFFAAYKVSQFFISLEAKFHNLIASFRNVFELTTVVLFSVSFRAVPDLVLEPCS